MDSQAGRIVIAYHGTGPAQTALRWAAAEAARRQRPLTVLHVLDFLETIPGPAPQGWWPDLIPPVSDPIASEGAHRAGGLGRIEISALTRHGPVARALVEISAEADLLVLGAPAHGDLARVGLGSAVFAVSGRAHCPVIVVRGEPGVAVSAECPVVVGVDGSPGSEPALDYAATVATAAGAALIVVTTYDQAPADHEDASVRVGAERIAAAAVAAARQRRPWLDVQSQVLIGAAATELTAVSGRAGLLVVGPRGHGGFVGLILGSVSHSVLCSAACPVAVVRSAGRSPSN